MSTTRIITMSLIAGGLAFGPNAQAAPNIGSPTSVSQSGFSVFTPNPTRQTRLDFDTWDFILSETVLYMGPSTRKRVSANAPRTGTRIRNSHKSPYRMEGNKVLYELIAPEIEAEISAYVDDLEKLGGELPIAALPRNEQLAYWINLHNAAAVEAIKAAYPGPGSRPLDIRPIAGSDAKLHDAKILNVGGVSLSLRDIREKIVYPNWDNPDVAFAFYHGHLGGPSLNHLTYQGRGLAAALKENAEEFVNALRGFDQNRISPYFTEIAPWFFPAFESDLTAYLKTRMRPDVFAAFEDANSFKPGRYELVVSDVTGGYGLRSGMDLYGNFGPVGGANGEVYTGNLGLAGLGETFTQYISERTRKMRELQKQDWFREGLVTIIDHETEDANTDREVE